MLPSRRSPQSHQCLNGFFLKLFIVAVLFLRIPFTIIWACMEASRRNKSSIGIKALPIFWFSGQRQSNAKKSRFRPNRNLTGTVYHWSVILRSFCVVLNSAKRDANGFFKVLLLSSHLLISRHPVQKSKFCACAVTGYCSFKNGRTCICRIKPSRQSFTKAIGWHWNLNYKSACSREFWSRCFEW